MCRTDFPAPSQEAERQDFETHTNGALYAGMVYFMPVAHLGATRVGAGGRRVERLDWVCYGFFVTWTVAPIRRRN